MAQGADRWPPRRPVSSFSGFLASAFLAKVKADLRPGSVVPPAYQVGWHSLDGRTLSAPLQPSQLSPVSSPRRACSTTATGSLSLLSLFAMTNSSECCDSEMIISIYLSEQWSVPSTAL